MKNRGKGIFAVVLALCALMTACRFSQAHEEKQEVSRVRLYDVIQGDEEAYEDYQYQWPTIRHGLVYTVGEGSGTPATPASVYSALEALEYRSGLKIDYTILGSWKELRQELAKVRGDGSTKLVLFNNSYDESLIKEVLNGGYIDFEPMMRDAGIYNDENYQQAVLEAGQIDTRQLLVPILYNIPGAIGAVETYQASQPSYDAFLQQIMDAMDSEEDYAQMAVISKAILEDRDPDLFWYAAGQHWADYQNQQAFFEQLYTYVTTYWEKEHCGGGLQYRWADYIQKNDADNRDNDISPSIPSETLYTNDLEMLGADQEANGIMLWAALLSQTAYVAEASGAENEPYHSVMGLINWGENYIGSPYWRESLSSQAGNNEMGYWAIQMFEQEGYAAQPICYVAALDDGDEEAAFRLVEALLQQKFAPQMGFTTYTPGWQMKMETWVQAGQVDYNYFGGSSRAIRYYLKTDTWDEAQGHMAYQTWTIEGTQRKRLGEAVMQQLDHIEFAQVADREIMSIWQDALIECAESQLTAEAGYELLCQRMEAWQEDLK